VGVPFLLLLLVLAVSPAFLVQGMRVPLARTPADLGISDFEEVEFTAGDEPITLRGWWFPVAAAKGAVVLVHGGGDNRASAHAGLIELARDLRGRGYASLAFDMRNHGLSDSSASGTPSFGPTEANDVIAAVGFVATRLPGVPVAAIGFSMGGNAVLYAAVKEPRLAAVVTVATYARLSSILPNAVGASAGAPAFLMHPIIWSAEAFYGLPVSWAGAEDIAPRLAPGVLLLIHDEADPIVPVEHAKRLSALAPEAKHWITTPLPDDHPLMVEAGRWGSHSRTYVLHPEEFVDRVTAHFAARMRK